MHYLICGDSLVGFLSAVYDSYYSKLPFENIPRITHSKDDCTLLDTFSDTPEDVEKAQKVRNGIIKKGGTAAYTTVTNAYRNCNKNKESIIFEYLKIFFKHGKDTVNMYSTPEVVAFNDLVSKVYKEVHLLSGFIRMQEMSNGVYYAFYSSDNDILELLMPDLTARFNTQRFIVHDYKRRKMAYFDGKTCRYSLAPEKVEIELSEQESLFQSLWKQYHETVNIKERENKKLQQGFLPKKYRHFMNEF